MLKIGKQAFYRQAEMGLAQAYAYATEVMTENMMARDAEEGIGAFIEKRDAELGGSLIKGGIYDPHRNTRRRHRNRRTTPAMAQEITAAERTACKADYEKYCQGTFPGGGRIIACLSSHYAELAAACKKVVDTNKK